MDQSHKSTMDSPLDPPTSLIEAWLLINATLDSPSLLLDPLRRSPVWLMEDGKRSHLVWVNENLNYRE